jgi:hypothetical protein
MASKNKYYLVCEMKCPGTLDLSRGVKFRVIRLKKSKTYILQIIDDNDLYSMPMSKAKKEEADV